MNKALKGRALTEARPFRANDQFRLNTQGCALGYHSAALQASIRELAFTAAIGLKNLANKALELSGIGFRRAHPLFVFFDFVQHQLGEEVLPILGDLLKSFDGFLERLGHVRIIACRSSKALRTIESSSECQVRQAIPRIQNKEESGPWKRRC